MFSKCLCITQSGMLGDNLVIEPVEDITLSADSSVEKREPTTKVRHVVYKVQPKEEDATADDFSGYSADKTTLLLGYCNVSPSSPFRHAIDKLWWRD